jgi:hypothetical protein
MLTLSLIPFAFWSTYLTRAQIRADGDIISPEMESFDTIDNVKAKIDNVKAKIQDEEN